MNIFIAARKCKTYLNKAIAYIESEGYVQKQLCIENRGDRVKDISSKRQVSMTSSCFIEV